MAPVLAARARRGRKREGRRVHVMGDDGAIADAGAEAWGDAWVDVDMDGKAIDMKVGVGVGVDVLVGVGRWRWMCKSLYQAGSTGTRRMAGKRE